MIDEFITEQRSVDADGGAVGGGPVDDGLRKVIQSCWKTLFNDFKGELEQRVGRTEKQHLVRADGEEFGIFAVKRPRIMWSHAVQSCHADGGNG